MSAEDTVHEYYEALRRGEPLYPYFLEDGATWKAAISTAYEGYDTVAEALRDQTKSTDEWTVESAGATVTTRGDGSYALFHDDVHLGWTDTSTGQRWGFDTRWSGVLECIDEADQEWQFVQLHVSAPHDI
ncbi:nuclear transport factor 2 family protein [Haloarchaeobius sp. TZWWS8]|uniref:nuclear transport factor 2 family protein n=1 Tax=Haloarchaeobius sp. TZWWS8 TaxID=3446121 RepID=UPI003EBB1779